ncbi:MAG TPA: ATP-dependent helicase, partial [Bacteroidia bacterium]|nr:ATP-dependent helicase [Bacteroidia bacterium]
NRLFTGKYASRSAEDNFKSGEHFALQPFMTILIPLMNAYALNDQIEIMRILRDYSPLLSLEGANRKRKISEIKHRVQSAIERVHELWANSSIREILTISSELELISLSYRLTEHLQRNPRLEEYDEGVHTKEKGDWLMDEFFNFDTSELTTYRKFILNQTPFSTQHGVKGDEFSKVLVVFDDTEANWNNFSFTKLFTPNTVGKSGTPGQQARSLNLAYVCFSRAKADLRIILFTESPNEAKTELMNQGLFREDQISIVT